MSQSRAKYWDKLVVTYCQTLAEFTVTGRRDETALVKCL